MCRGECSILYQRYNRRQCFNYQPLEPIRDKTIRIISILKVFSPVLHREASLKLPGFSSPLSNDVRSGGYVYRGQAYADLIYGAYVFADVTLRSVALVSPAITTEIIRLSLSSIIYLLSSQLI